MPDTGHCRRAVTAAVPDWTVRPMAGSVRRAASRRLREDREVARRHGACRPPWPTVLGRAAGWVWGWHRSAAGLLAGLAVWVAVLSGAALARSRSAGIAAATTGSLQVLWQVQAASVGLVFALAVFVFGLLPQARGRVTYREFLGRSWALPLVVFNVGSLLFTGLVLLGLGHQVPQSRHAASHGWSVTVATVVSLASIASILILLGRTVIAIDPATGMRVRRQHARKAVGKAVRSELRELTCLEIMLGPFGPGIGASSPGDADAEMVITARGSAARRVRDVSLRALALLKWHAKRNGRMTPLVHAWPGKIVAQSAPLITIDSASGPVARWWARRCVRLGAARADPLSDALEAMHAEAIEHIRAGRPVEAAEDLEALGDLLEPVWQGYAAYGRPYDQEAAGAFWIYQPTVGARIMQMLDPELRAAAVSADEQIRVLATRVPHGVARSALRHKAAGSIRDGLTPLLSVYDTVIGDLTDGGREQLPVTGLARRRTGAPFRTVLSFTLGDLQREIDRATYQAAGLGVSADAGLDAAEFAILQLSAAHHQLLVMLRRAVQVQDITTLREVLPKWRMPDTSRVRDAFQESQGSVRVDGRPPDGQKAPEALARREDLVQSLDLADNELDAMFFRLFADALQADRETQGERNAPAARPTDQSEVQHSPEPGIGRPDPAVAMVLGVLPATRPWQVLATAVETARHDWFRPPRDEEILPAGVIVTRFTNPFPAALDAFVLAAMLRPDLIAGEPDEALAMVHAEALRSAVDRVVAHEKAWLQRYGVPADTADQRGAALRDRITEVEHTARRKQQELILASPICPAAESRLRAVAQEEFRALDITSRMLAWAGNSADRLGDQDANDALAAVLMTAPREMFLDAGDGNIPDLGTELGRLLAEQTMAELLVAAGREGITRALSRAEGSAMVRETITALRTSHALGHDKQSASARVIALIPAPPFDIRDDLGITGTAGQSWLHGIHPGTLESDRDRTLKNLGLAERLSWQLYGLIDDVPVIQTRVLQDRIVLLDLARFVQVRLASKNSSALDEPVLDLAQPDEAEVRARLQRGSAVSRSAGQLTGTAAESTEAVLENRVREEMVKVTISFRLMGRICVCDKAAAHILAWEE